MCVFFPLAAPSEGGQHRSGGQRAGPKLRPLQNSSRVHRGPSCCTADVKLSHLKTQRNSSGSSERLARGPTPNGAGDFCPPLPPPPPPIFFFSFFCFGGRRGGGRRITEPRLVRGCLATGAEQIRDCSGAAGTASIGSGSHYTETARQRGRRVKER